jgi:hypothetical protein
VVVSTLVATIPSLFVLGCAANSPALRLTAEIESSRTAQRPSGSESRLDGLLAVGWTGKW